MKAELVPENGDDPIPINRDITVIGRRSYCDIVINHASLSKRHAVVVKTDGLLIIRDLASTNGTKVKGQRIRWAALLPDDKISLGAYKFRVYLGPDDLPSPSERARRGERISPPRVVGVGALAVAVGVAAQARGPQSPAADFPRPSSDGIPQHAFGSIDESKDDDSDSQWRDAMYAEQVNNDAIELGDEDLLPSPDDDLIILD